MVIKAKALLLTDKAAISPFIFKTLREYFASEPMTLPEMDYVISLRGACADIFRQLTAGLCSVVSPVIINHKRNKSQL